MFTGLIEAVGTIESLTRDAAGLRWTIVAPPLVGEIAHGDSVSVAGVCLTAAQVDNERFSGTAIWETLKISTLSRWRVGQRVNLELALKVGDRLGGHVVTGHIDTVGQVRNVRDEGGEYLLTVSFPRQYHRWAIPKGSIAIDGVSLTIAKKQADAVTVALIPETLARTTLGDLKTGDAVNLEFDQFIKAVVPENSARTFDETLLARVGW